MQKKVITAETIRQIAVGGVLPLPAGAIITPLARDLAAERKLKLVAGRAESTFKLATGTLTEASDDLIRSIVRRVLQDGRLARNGPERLKSRHFRLHQTAIWPRGEASCGVHTAPLIDQEAQGSRMRAGYVSLSQSGQTTRQGPEVLVVLEGELHLGMDQEHMTGYPGDMLFVPGQASMHGSTPSWVRFAYVCI